MPPRPHVLLVGDSISIGYHDAAVAALADVADVTRVPGNGGTSGNILERLEEWIVAVRPDLVHINCGLHDLARRPAEGLEPRTPLHLYEAQVRRIVERLSAETEAAVVWASSTPVNDERHRLRKNFQRRQDDVAAYNAAADRVMRELRVPIDDLHAVVVDAGADALLGPDGVHFRDDAYKRLGAAVADAVRNVLAAEGLVPPA